MEAAERTAEAAAFARAHGAVLADRRIQFALPPAPRPVPPHWLSAFGRWFEAHWPAIRLFVWAALALLALALLWALATRLRGLRLSWWRRRATADDTSAPEWRPEAAPARALLAEADALAGAGRFAEAARLVLLRSIADIARRHPEAVRPATTARDLAEDARVPAAARPAFRAIAGVVESALFADRGATAAAWTRARDAYADFALAGRWR